MAALFYLLACSLKNGVLVRLRRLRQPKYAIGALLGVAYFYFYFYRFLYAGAYQPRPHRPSTSPVDFAVTPEVAFNLAALALLALLVLFAWIIPAERSAINLTESEVAWLLPAPISRKQLIRFKLLKSQLGLLFFALLMTMVTGRFARDGHALIHTLGWWIVLATFRLHRLGASFVLTRLMERGMSTLKRRIIVLGTALIFILVLIAWRQSAPSPPDLRSMFLDGKFGPFVSDLAASGPAPVLLTPFRFLVRPWFASGAYDFLIALGPALLVVAAHYVWVIRSAVAFEEASVQLAEKRAAWLAARKAGDMRFRSGPRVRQEPLFKLAPAGSPIAAFVWKAWIQAGGRRTLRIAAISAAVLVAVSAISSLTGEWRAVGTICGLLGFIAVCALIFGGPQATAQSVRRELQAADILRTAPVRGSKVILGQMLGPSIVWSCIQWIGLVLMMLGGFVVNELPHEIISLIPSGVAAAGIILLPLNVVSALIPTGVMLLFPGWFRPGEMRGLEATGLGLLMVFAQLFFIGLSLVAPTLAGVGVAYATNLFIPTWTSLLLGAVVAASTLGLEAWIGTIALGSVFERFDLSFEQ
jgi:ABC-2 type transport system permease protein